MIETRPLGATGLLLSPIGFGAFKIGRNEGIKYAQCYELPDEPAVAELLMEAANLGINYIDTAPAYGESEARLGRLSPGLARRFIISTKVGETFTAGRSTYDFSRASLIASLGRSRQRLGREQLDLVFVHAPADDAFVQTQTEVVDVLREERAAGRVRAIGWSGKTVAAARAALAWADALMIEYHLDERSHEPLLAEAAERGVGVVVKKALASGRLPARAALEFVLSQPAVCSAVLGTLSAAHLREAVAVAQRLRAAAKGPG